MDRRSTLGRPKVFTRSRLLIDRLGELKFLDARLLATSQPSTALQGTEENVELNAFVASLTAQFAGGASTVRLSTVNPASLSLPSPTSSNNITVTGIQGIQNLLATRDYLRSTIRETELDDSHDLNGRTALL